jgi:hypothetical protein
MAFWGMSALLLGLLFCQTNITSRATENKPWVESRPSAPNLLVNPGFEPPAPFQIDACTGKLAGELQVPTGWTAYFNCKQAGDADNINRRPEYRPADMTYAYRVKSPPSALKYFNFWALNKSAGVYQVVNGIQPGATLRFSMWVQLWTSNCDRDPPTSQCEPGNLEARLCMDTDGGAGFNVMNPGVVCGQWARQSAWDKYTELTLDAVAKSDQVIVALNTRAEWAVKHNDTYADDASLIVLLPPPTATPTHTPTPAIPIETIATPTPSINVGHLPRTYMPEIHAAPKMRN